MANEQERELSGQNQELEVNTESKGLETAKALIAQKFAAADGKEVVVNTLDFVSELMDAGVDNLTVDDISTWFKEMLNDGYDVKPLVKAAGKTPMSWKIVSAPALNAEVPVIEPSHDEVIEPVVADKTKGQLPEAQLAALEEYITSLGEGAEFTGKDAEAALQVDDKLEKPSSARVVALLAKLANAGKVKWNGGDSYGLIPEKQKSKDVPPEFYDFVQKLAEGGSTTLSLDRLKSEADKYTQIEVDESTARYIAQQLVEKGVLEAVPGSDSEWSIVSTGTKPEVKDVGVTFPKMLEALAVVAEITDVEGMCAAFKSAGMTGTTEEVLRAMPGLIAEGLVKEEAGTITVNKEQVAERRKSTETEPDVKSAEGERLQEAQVKAVEAYVNTQADAGGEITQAGALAMLEADAAMGDVTDLEVFKIFKDLERARKIKFISNGRYERVVPEEEGPEKEESKTEQELFDERLVALAIYVGGQVGAGEITIAAAKQTLEAQGDLGDNIPEADMEKLFAELVKDGTVRALDNGNYEAVTDDEEEADEAFTEEQMDVAQRWLKSTLSKSSVRFIDIVTMGDVLAKAGLSKAGAAAILAQLEKDKLITPLTKGRSWTLNKKAIEALEDDEEGDEIESAADFYERTGVLKSDLVAFARDVLGLPYMAAGIVNGKYTGKQLQDIFAEYEASENQGGTYRPPSVEAWNAFPDEDLLGDDKEDEEEPEPEVEEKKPGFFGKLFGKKNPKKPVRAERAGAEAVDSADIATWKASRRGKSFINSLTELNGDLAGVQDYFDQDNEVDLEQAMTAQEMFDTHYAKVRNIFDRQLEAMTGYSMYDIFNLGPEGEQMYADFGKWVVRQAYLDAGTPQGRGRLEKIISLDASVQEKSSFLASVVSPQRLQELQDKRDDWKTAYKVTRITSGDARDARDRLGKAVPTSWFAEVKGIRTARRWDEYVQEVEEDFDRAPEVKAKIEKQRQQIIAELGSMNGLLDAESDKTSPTSGFAKMLRSMINKIGSTEEPAKGEVTQTEREKAEQAEQVLQAVKKVQAQREAAGVSAYAFYDEQEQNKADLEILGLEAKVRKLVQKEFAKALAAKIDAGKAKGIVDLRAETIMTIERLAGNLTGPDARRNATVAIAKVLEEQAQELAKSKPEGPKAEVLKELENSITLLRKRSRI